MMKQRIWMLAVFAVAACGGGGGAKQPSTTVAAQTSAVLTVQPASLSATVDGQPMELAIDAAGKITVNGKLVGTIGANGEARDANDKVIASIATDGRVTIQGEPQEDIVIRDDGSVVNRGEAIVSIGADAVLAGKLISEADAKITYAGPPEGRRAMMLAWLVSVSTEKQGEPTSDANPMASPAP